MHIYMHVTLVKVSMNLIKSDTRGFRRRRHGRGLRVHMEWGSDTIIF